MRFSPSSPNLALRPRPPLHLELNSAEGLEALMVASAAFSQHGLHAPRVSGEEPRKMEATEEEGAVIFGKPAFGRPCLR